MKSWARRRREIEVSRCWHGRTGGRSRWRKRPYDVLLAVLDKAIRATPLFARGYRNALDLRRVEFDLVPAGLPPSFDGYRILHVSDPHLDYLPDLVGVLRKLVEGLDVDMLAVTGDIRGDRRQPAEHPTALLVEALAGVKVRGPRLAVLGNHDPVEMVDALEAVGIDVLVNRSLVLQRGVDRLRVTGLDDVHSFYTEAAQAALADHDGEFRIALVHSAEVADDADRAGYALYLCGHTHGGQICLPGGRPIITHLTRCRHAASGLWRQGRMVGYTSRGVGVSELPLRCNTRGEVAVITLRRAERL
ncbi:MAG: metallophosphoesterase [Alphaproteobacteria bacterium]|nr:metallophosphoesterase [Alphaproteobacteria bacterium]